MANQWISAQQIRQSLTALKRVHPYFGMTFLAFKARRLPVGSQIDLNFSSVMRDFLQQYYKPSESYSGYYNPFITSNPSNRWVTNKYPSGALQRITVDTFSAAILHTKKGSQWGWRPDYIDVLLQSQTRTHTAPIPLFHLAIWLYRNDPYVTPSALIQRFLYDFHVHPAEHTLFSLETVEHLPTSAQRLPDRTLFRLIGWPPGETHGDSITIGSIEMREVGPALALQYQPTPRLNVITGDNSLGKTFLLDCAWWAVTGTWTQYPAEPRRDARRSLPRMRFSLDASGRERHFTFKYSFDEQSWAAATPASERRGGLAIYCRHDGSYVIWDPASTGKSARPADSGTIVLDRDSLWHGKSGLNDYGQRVSLCNGLLSDWVDWQTRSTRFDEIFSAFVQCLHILSPPGGQRLEVDEPTQMAGDEQEMPALRMPYGSIPFVHSSAGVQRVVGLVYVMIWTWFRHQRRAKMAGRTPQDHLILIVDEIEAHLHPRWQRSIVPSLLSAVDALAGELTTQLHLATHSPLVLASTETIFERKNDSLHHLVLDNDYVNVERLDFTKFGNVDSWLRSDIFGLKHARSLPAEVAIERAKALQLSDNPDTAQVIETDEELLQVLRDDDDFWPRWRYFAKAHRGGNR